MVRPSSDPRLFSRPAAAFFGHAACVAILLFYGINDQIVNNKGHTAKEEAKGSEVSEIFTLFSRKVRNCFLLVIDADALGKERPAEEIPSVFWNEYVIVRSLLS